MKMVRSSISAGLLEVLISEKEFWTSAKTFSFLAETDYFKEAEGDAKSSLMDWPPVLKTMMSEGK